MKTENNKLVGNYMRFQDLSQDLGNFNQTLPDTIFIVKGRVHGKFINTNN